MRPAFLLFLVSLVLPFAGCASTDDSGDMSYMPDWVLRPAGVYEDENGVKALYAVGAGDKSASVVAQRTWAESNARDALSRTFQTHVQNMITTYMREAADKYNMEETASLITNNEAVSRQLSNAVILGSQIVNTYQDPKTGTLYFHMRMPLDTNFLKSYKEQSKAVLREQFAKYSKELKDDALADLDKAVENSATQMEAQANPYEK
ncbi:MAG: LPP20 family lipoprotein [Planctomycetota bacterium]